MLASFIKFRSAVTVLVLVVLAVAALNLASVNQATASNDTSVIVELKDDPGAVYAAKAGKSGNPVSTEALQAYRAGLTAKQDEFLTALAANGVTATVMSRDVKNFDGSLAATIPLRYTLVYNGVALKVSASSIDAIKSMPQVKNVHNNDLLQTTLNKSVNYIRAPRVYGSVKELTQFDNIREGYEGQGMYISVIDTGVDWTHPMFGGDPTPPRLAVAPPTPAATNTNQKVVYYLPLTDTAAYDGFGHGTHVASTAAGYLAQVPGPDRLPNTADDIRVHGVAPQAKIMSYKVCSDVGSTGSAVGVPLLGGCQTADIITALEDSVSPFTLTGQPKPVANVINMSLGGGGGPNTPTAIASSNAALTGTIVVAASGNSGPGEGTTGSPAAGTHVISVGATTHPGSAETWSIDVPGAGRLPLNQMSGSTPPPLTSITAPYVYIDNGIGPWPASVSGKIALVQGCFCFTFFDFAAQAQASGALAMILIQDDGANAIKTMIPAATISTADGQRMINALSTTDNNNPANGAVSQQPAKFNKFMTDAFMGQMAGFSSRGPVVGLGQVKPDISAPGVTVLAAVPPGSLLSALSTVDYVPEPNRLMTTDSSSAPNYSAIDGTSMATPHMAGAVALIKQAHPDWTPDMIRTAFINTATNMRDGAGAAKPEGATADSIISQGGGLIDVSEANNAKALIGVAGDGISTPGMLGSHSFGEVAVINSRVTHTVPVTVTVRDLSGQGGTYNLAVANNRDLQLAGINVSTSQSSVTLAPNGQASFTVNATVDGDALRDVMAAKINGTGVVFERIQMQWFLTANRSDGGESLRMPFYFKPGWSLPIEPVMSTTTHTDIMPASDAGAQRDVNEEFLAETEGVTYKDIPINVDASTYQIDAKTEWLQVGDTGHPDLDYQLLDPDGNVIDQSGNAVGPEFVSIRVERPGTYRHRVIGYSGGGTEFTVITTLHKGNTPPVLNAISADFTNAQGQAIDFDGSVNLSWQPTPGATSYEIERSAGGGDFELVGTAGQSQTSIALANQPQGELAYRLRALAPGQIGNYVTAPSNVSTVIVEARTKVDITTLVSTAMSNVSFSGGVFKMDLNIKNNSANTYVPLVELKVIGITSASGTVTVKNADNGGNGKSAATAALFGYSNLLGTDQQFAAAEITGNRNLEFNDSAAEMFSFDVNVTAFQSGAGGSGGAAGAAPEGGGGGTGGSSEAGLLPLTNKLRITVNPLTKSVTAKLL
jgi:subtilisin family serine protease